MTGLADDLVVSVMTEDDVHLAVEWAAREGWNPGLADDGAFRSADPHGFLIGRVDGVPVAVISAVSYAGGFSFVGLYIVDPEWRGRGYGWALWSEALARVSGVVGLDGVVEQQANYATSGFVLAHRNIRFGGVPVGQRQEVTDLSDVVELGPDDLPAVEAIDSACFGARRTEFLRRWLAVPGALAAGVRSGSGLSGYGVIRPARDGMKVGPLFADDADTARAILGRLVAHAGEGTRVFLDVPEPHLAGVALAQEHGLEPVFETARMYRGGSLDLPLDRIFGITTFELG